MTEERNIEVGKEELSSFKVSNNLPRITGNPSETQSLHFEIVEILKSKYIVFMHLPVEPALVHSIKVLV